MRVEFKVIPAGDKWRVQRGTAETLCCDTFEAALRGAENLARGVAAMGEIGVVKVVGHDLVAAKTFVPDLPTNRASVRFEPEKDEAARRSL